MAQAALPILATVGGSLMSAGSSGLAGRAQAGQFAAEAAQYDRQARDVDLQALQAGERRREELNAMVANYSAMRAARGLSDDTPTAVAIQRELRRQSVRDEGAERLGFLNQASSLRMGASMRRRAGRNAVRAGWLEAFGTVMSAGGDLMALRGGGKIGQMKSAMSGAKYR